MRGAAVLAAAAALLASVPAGRAAGADAGAAAAQPGGYLVMDIPAIKRALHDGRGHVVLVHFWASWCYPCLEELPTMEKFAREMKPRGLEVLSLSLDDPDRAGARVIKILNEVAPSLTRNIARFGDADELISIFDDRWEGSIPAVFLYDQNGQRRGRLIGEASRRDLDQLVARLLKPPPAKR
jgi:thiol-disulfide isomerase/thioredoxin